MAPIIISNQPRTIVITPGMFGEDENKHIIESGELPKYAVGLFESNGSGPRKRKRLTHLTPEEKIMRRKLKNRVAAQTARDRKKARLETLEEAVTKIHEQTKKLLDVNSQLLERTEALERENEVLRQRLGLESIESFTKEKKEELSSIKHEFNDIVMTQNSLNRERSSGESSDDEGYCILTPYEGSDISVGDESCTESSRCEASKCVSPVPAAGSCQISEADPLASQSERSLDATQVADSDIATIKVDTEFDNLLRQLEAIEPSQYNGQEGNAIGSTDCVAPSLSTNKITVPLNIFHDHEYSKPDTSITWSQECPDISIETTFSTQTTPTTIIDSNKPTALVKKPIDNMQQLLTQLPNELCKSETKDKADVIAPVPVDLNIDDVFKSLFTDDDLIADQFSETESMDSGVSSCSSPLSDTMLDTPAPLSDIVDPFDLTSNCNFWDDQLAKDLFPQLATM